MDRERELAVVRCSYAKQQVMASRGVNQVQRFKEAGEASIVHGWPEFFKSMNLTGEVERRMQCPSEC